MGANDVAWRVSILIRAMLPPVNGAPLPYVPSAANRKVEFVSQQVIVSVSGTWSALSSIRTTRGATVVTQSQASSGTLTLSGSIASFKDNSDGLMKAVTVSPIVTRAPSGASRISYLLQHATRAHCGLPPSSFPAISEKRPYQQQLSTLPAVAASNVCGEERFVSIR